MSPSKRDGIVCWHGLRISKPTGVTVFHGLSRKCLYLLHSKIYVYGVRVVSFVKHGGNWIVVFLGGLAGLKHAR